MKQLQQLTGRISVRFRRSALLLMALMFALTSIALQPAAQAQQQIGGSSGPSPSSSIELGLMTGAFYNEYNQTLNGHAEQILNEYKYLGVKWIRIEANRACKHGEPQDSVACVSHQWIYRRLVELAHARGIKVIMVFVPTRELNDDDNTNIDSFITQVLYGDPLVGDTMHTSLQHYAKHVFGQDYATSPDGYEIGNEPNFCQDTDPKHNPTLCTTSGGLQGFRIGGRTFAWLLRYAWEWKTHNTPPGTILVSGGILNVYPEETLWWDRFLHETAAWVGERPYDYFGIHPYDGAKVIPQECINLHQTTCLLAWENDTQARLINLKATMDTIADPVNRNTHLFVTELGWEYISENYTCPFSENCVSTSDQLRYGMQAAVNAATRSGVVDLVILQIYRDDPPSSQLDADDLRYFGLRSNWDSTLQRWPAKPSWDKFRELAGGNSTGPEQAWEVVSCPDTPLGRNPIAWPCRKRYWDTNFQSFEYYIEDLAGKGVIEGTPVEGGSPYYTWTVNPEQPVTRAVFASWIVRAKNWVFVDTSNVQHFHDVPASSHYFSYVETVVAQPRSEPIFVGYPCGGPGEPCDSANRPYLRPGSSLTRGQASKIVSLAWNWNEPVTTQTFEDVPPDHTFYLFIERMAQRELVNGYPCGGLGEPCIAPYNRPYFRSNNTLSRGQVIKIISNAIENGQAVND